MEVLSYIAFGLFTLFCVTKGINIGIKLRKDENIEVPSLNPIKKFQEIKEEKEYKFQNEKEQLEYEVMLENIENYNGTGIGQKDLPRK